MSADEIIRQRTTPATSALAPAYEGRRHTRRTRSLVSLMSGRALARSRAAWFHLRGLPLGPSCKVGRRLASCGHCGNLQIGAGVIFDREAEGARSSEEQEDPSPYRSPATCRERHIGRLFFWLATAPSQSFTPNRLEDCPSFDS